MKIVSFARQGKKDTSLGPSRLAKAAGQVVCSLGNKLISKWKTLCMQWSAKRHTLKTLSCKQCTYEICQAAVIHSNVWVPSRSRAVTVIRKSGTASSWRPSAVRLKARLLDLKWPTQPGKQPLVLLQ